MASPNFRINGGAVGVPANVSASSAVTATLDSTDGVRQVEWFVASTDETTAIGDYALVQSGSVGQTVATTALIAGTAARLRCRINGGVNLSTGLNDPNGTNAYGKFGVLTAAGYMVGCVGETTEQDATSGWASLVNPIIRVAPAAAPVSSVTGTPPIVSSGGVTPAISITAASGVAAGSQSSAHYTLLNTSATLATNNTLVLRGSSAEASFGNVYSAGTVSTTGFIRLARNFIALSCKTSGGTDHPVLTEDNADAFVGGSSSLTAGWTWHVKTGGSHNFKVNNAAKLVVSGTADVALATLGTATTISEDISGPGLVINSGYQATLSSDGSIAVKSGAGEDFSLKNGTFVGVFLDNTTVYLASNTHSFTATGVGFYGTSAAPKPNITGSRGGNAALASLLTALAGLGLITDSTSA